MTTNFWDADGDFDYEAHYDAGQLEKAATTAQNLGAPDLTPAIHYFALKDLPQSSFTPELLTALKKWQHLVNEIENAPIVQDVKELRRQAEDTGRAIENLTETATGQLAVVARPGGCRREPAVPPRAAVGTPDVREAPVSDSQGSPLGRASAGAAGCTGPGCTVVELLRIACGRSGQ